MVISIVLAFNVLIILLSCDKCSDVLLEERLDCYPEFNPNKDLCEQRKCCWKPSPEGSNAPYCYFPKEYSQYFISDADKQPRKEEYSLKKNTSTWLKEFTNPKLLISRETRSHLKIKIYDECETRWEPEMDYRRAEADVLDFDYSTEISYNPLALKVLSRNRTLLSLSGYLSNSLILSDQFLQMTFNLHDSYIGYGLGENRESFPLRFNDWKRISFWNRDQPPSTHTNLYGTHNFLMSMTKEGHSFGLFFLNTNAQEVSIQPMPAITYRTIGGVLEFHVFVGPKPLDVLRQYHEFIGFTQMPPRWAFNYHLSRYGYKSTRHVQEVYQRNIDKGISIGTMWVDIDYMDRYRDWTIGENFLDYADFVREIRLRDDTRSVLIVDPAVAIDQDYKPYLEAKNLGILINDSRDGKPIEGKVWPGITSFPDFSHPSCLDWWHKNAVEYNKTIPFDGLWIDMNEPSSFVDGSLTGCDPSNKYDNPAYVPPILGGLLYAKTICPSSLHHDTEHYNKHNLYGYHEANVTYQTLLRMNPGKRPFILTRSSFAGSGKFTNHWTGDNFSRWEDLLLSIRQIINFNIFGMPMVGPDVCGFLEDTSPELCMRWHQLGSFFPFFRNHNTNNAKDQDPATFQDDYFTGIYISLSHRRYQIPFLYTLLFDAHLKGSSVINALSFVYPQDLNTHHIDEQFMLGECIIVTPILRQGQKTLAGYLPEGYWHSFYDEEVVYSPGDIFVKDAKLYGPEMHTRGGCTMFWPIEGRGYIARIYLDYPDTGLQDRSSSYGHLYFDDGVTKEGPLVKLIFATRNRTITVSSVGLYGHYEPRKDEKIINIYLFNIQKRPKRIFVNGKLTDFNWNEKYLSIDSLSLDVTKDYKINYSFN